MFASAHKSRLSGRQWLIVVALLGLLFAQAASSIPRLSLTADEPVYMGAGYALLRGGDLRMATSAQHPPLLQELAALPLLLQPGPELDELQGWSSAEMVRFAAAFVAWYGDALDAAAFAARMPLLWLTLLWAAFIFRWAADWFGPWGGIAALTLFAFDPNVLAHAPLATNDVGFAALSFIAVFAATRFLRRPSWRYLLLAGLALGGSLSSKSSGFFTALVLAALFPLAALLGGEGRARRLARALLQLAFILGVGVLVLWASYGFESHPFPLATQWEVWSKMRQHLDAGHTGYMLGQVRDTGWLAYYPLAFVLKTPPLTLALLAWGLAAALWAGPRRWQALLPLWIYLGGYAASTLLSSVNTGYRFLLPVLPFFFLLIAGLFRNGPGRLRWLALLPGVALALGIHPHYLTYFNFLAGGPAGGRNYLVDSNLDWGQAFPALREYMDEQGLEQVWLSYYTYADPALYGVRYRPIAPSPGAPPLLPARFNPAPGVYAISATTLQGVMVVDPDVYSWFRQRPATARPGAAIFVYQVTEPDPRPTWLAQCAAPAAPLTPEVVAEGFGREDLRLAYFDCQHSWLYPAGGQTAGWYALRRDLALAGDPFIQGRLAAARLSYQQRADRASPAFVIYEPPPLPAACSAEPQPLDGPLDFMGYTAPHRPSIVPMSLWDVPLGGQPVRPGETLEIETCWRVTARTERPLSLMLHLVGPGGTPVVVGDGLGTPPETWQAGDVIVQRHSLELPPDAPGGDYALYSGAYWLDSMQRWQVLLDARPAGDQLTLSPVTVVAGK